MSWSDWKKLCNSVVINTTPAFEFVNSTYSYSTHKTLTAASDGVLFAWANRGSYNDPRSLIVTINGIEVINYNVANTTTNPLKQVVPIKKGDLIDMSFTTNGGDEYFGVYYFE